MRRMLVVEDEELVGLFLREELADIGFNVDVCATATPALRLCEEHEYTAAILDVGLPDFAGDDLAKRCRGLRPSLPIVLATGRSATEVAAQFTGDPFVAVVEKPYELTQLIERLNTLGVEI
jgi:DNA-binding response OmpR family regulator